MKFHELAKKRYSVRGFTDQKVDPKLIETAIATATLAPTAKNLQAYKFYLVNTTTDIEKIKQATPCTFGAGTFLILAVDKTKAYTRSRDGYNFADIDGGIVGAHLMLALTDLGLGSTWVGFFDDQKLIENFPELKESTPIGIFPCGYIDSETGKPTARHEERHSLSESLVIL